MYTVPFHWEAMRSNVLPLSEYCNAMSNFYGSDSLSLWHVVTCCLDSCVCVWTGSTPADKTFLFFHEGKQSPEGGLREGRGETRGVAGHRDRPFILKGLFTMVISAWGTGYNTRYQGIKARSVQQDLKIYILLVGFPELSYLFFFFSRVWESCPSENTEEHHQCHYLKTKLALRQAFTIVLFIFLLLLL